MILDLIFFVFILAFAVLGFVRGFFKTLVGFFGWAVSILLAYLLAKAVANALLSAGVSQWLLKEGSLFDKIYGIMPEGLKGISIDSINEMIAEGKSQDYIKEYIKSQSGGLVFFASNIIQSTVCSDMYLSSALDNAAQVISLELTYHIYVILTGVALFIVLRVVVMGVSILFKGKLGNGGLVGRIGGIALGAVRGLAYACFVLVIASYVAGVSPTVNNQLDESKVGRPVISWVTESTSRMISGELNENEQYREMIRIIEERTFEADET